METFWHCCVRFQVQKRYVDVWLKTNGISHQPPDTYEIERIRRVTAFSRKSTPDS